MNASPRQKSVVQKDLSEICEALSAPQPSPAGVAMAAMSGAMAVSLLIKVLLITGKGCTFVQPAQDLALELRNTADHDARAVERYMRLRDAESARALLEVPLRAIRALARGAELCAQVVPQVSGLIAADVDSALEILTAAARAAILCLSRNLEKAPNSTVAAELKRLNTRVQAASRALASPETTDPSI
ncbi:MAG: cyclodeaminase/cyclohydrolase family protein [Acidobacteriota bacterium]